MNMELVDEYIQSHINSSENALFIICENPYCDEEKYAATCLLMTFPSNERKAG